MPETADEAYDRPVALASYALGMRIPMDQLSQEALLGVVDDFILREGTDYGHGDPSLEDKRAKILRQLRKGEAHVVFDGATESCSIVVDEKP